jgi:hypothetical protein
MTINIQRETSGKTIDMSDDRTDSFDAIVSRDTTNIDDNIGLSYFTEEQNNDDKSESLEEPEEYKENNFDDYSDNCSLEQRDTYVQGISFEEEQALRATYLVQLKNLYKRGYVSERRFGPEDSSNILKCEVLRLKKEKEIESGVNYCKTGLVFLAKTLEMVNKNMLGAPVQLDGFSGHVLATQEDYNEVFEELYCKYSTSIEMGPEIKFLTLFASSVFMYHLSKVTAELAAVSMNSQTGSKNKKEMSGPSKESEDLLRKLSTGEYSDLSSIESEAEIKVKPKRKNNKKK